MILVERRYFVVHLGTADGIFTWVLEWGLSLMLVLRRDGARISWPRGTQIKLRQLYLVHDWRLLLHILSFIL